VCESCTPFYASSRLGALWRTSSISFAASFSRVRFWRESDAVALAPVPDAATLCAQDLIQLDRAFILSSGHKYSRSGVAKTSA